MESFAGKRVVVVGLGKSGIAACRLLAARGATVIGNDAKARDVVGKDVLWLEADGIDLVLGEHGAARMSEADLVVVSPGVPELPEILAAEAAGVPVWGEVELAVRCLKTPAPIVAVGGTNGKSTTTSLLGALFERAGMRTFVGGNLGEPLASHVDETFDVIVLEVSSFQMERAPTFRPRVSVLLNVTADHLDRYPDFEAYARAKGNAFVNQTASDLAVVPAGDALCLAQAQRGKGSIVTFGPGGDVDVKAHAVVDAARSIMYDRSRLGLAGGHNALNVAAAIAAARPFELEPALVEEVLVSFRGLAHRMALVREVAAVRYYDDSKGTNVGASVTAVRGLLEDRVVLVCGGRDKGGSYEPLKEALLEKGRGAVLIGEAAPLLRDALAGVPFPVVTAASMETAVLEASRLAQPGDAVLLSPACSSFDMFRDYKERGDAFVGAVMGLKGDASR